MPMCARGSGLSRIQMPVAIGMGAGQLLRPGWPPFISVPPALCNRFSGFGRGGVSFSGGSGGPPYRHETNTIPTRCRQDSATRPIGLHHHSGSRKALADVGNDKR
jgi:hypothetical protein